MLLFDPQFTNVHMQVSVETEGRDSSVAVDDASIETEGRDTSTAVDDVATDSQGRIYQVRN